MTVPYRNDLLRAAGYIFPKAEHLVTLDQAREEHRERVRLRHIHAPIDASRTRTEARKQVYLFNAMIADPIHAWQRDVLIENRGIWLNRYRLALSSFMAEARPMLPGGSADVSPYSIAAE